ncbi:MAG TPA: VWA domain-containing protein [Thermoanaerobaculia bacterium]|nr:VWA domain-containing protein [Thermoanaerobaculia bacterium]
MDRLRVSCALALCLTAAFAFGLSAQTAPGPQGKTGFGESIDVRVVNLEVYVTDRDGRRITDLRREDFELFEDGRRVEIAHFDTFAPGAVTGAPAGNGPAAASPQAPAPAGSPGTPPPADPLFLVVYVDNVNVGAAHRARALTQVREFLDREMAPGDQVMIATYDLSLHVRQPFTSDREALGRTLDAIKNLSARGGESDRDRRTALETIVAIQEASKMQGTPCPLEIAEPARSFAASRQNEVLQTVSALKVLINSLSGLPGRKAVLHISDGIPVTPGEEVFQVLVELCSGAGTASGLADSVDVTEAGLSAYQGQQGPIDAQGYSTAKEWSELAAHANAHRVTLYTLQASGAEAPASSAADSDGTTGRFLRLMTVSQIERENRKGSLTSLAKDTGGRAILDVNDVLPDLARMREDFDSYYFLGYSSPRSGDGRQHRIEVKVNRPGARVRHRQSYRDKSDLEQTADRTLAALFHGTQANPLGVGIEIGAITPAASGRGFNVPVRLKIPLIQLAFLDEQAGLSGKLRLLVATQGPGGETSRVRQVQVPIRIPRDQALVALGREYLYDLTLTLAAGEQRIAVAIQDETTIKTSYLARDVHVGGGAVPKKQPF